MNLLMSAFAFVWTCFQIQGVWQSTYDADYKPIWAFKTVESKLVAFIRIFKRKYYCSILVVFLPKCLAFILWQNLCNWTYGLIPRNYSTVGVTRTSSKTDETCTMFRPITSDDIKSIPTALEIEYLDRLTSLATSS